MKVPSSNLFSALAWDLSIPDYPTLNGNLTLDGGEVEVALVGNKGMRLPWSSFLSRAEGRCGDIQRESILILEGVEKRILELHKAYFPNRWTGSARDLLNELRLRLICFYPDGTWHLWYQGSSVFNCLDVDIGLDSTSEVTEVRFDG
jgi:hypothetical protein